MYWDNYSIINPAASGFENKLHTNVQSMVEHNVTSPVNSIEFKKPSNNLFDFGIKLDKINSGIGLSVNSERNKTPYSKVRNDVLNLNYNYQFEFSKEHKLSIGASIGYYRRYSNNLWYYTYHEHVNQNHLDMYGYKDTINALTSNFGINYKFKKLNLGASATQLFAPRINSREFADRYRNFYFNASYEFDVNEKWRLEYFTLLRVENKLDWNYKKEKYENEYNYGINTGFRVKYNQIFDGGLIIKTFQDDWNLYTLNFGAKVKKNYRIAYSIGSSDLYFDRHTELNHQLSLSFVLK